MNGKLRFEEYDKKNIDIYYGDKSIGYIERKGKGWYWKFGHPVNRKTYEGSNEFIIDPKKHIETVFYNIFDLVGRKHENQMIRLKGLHFLPIIEND